MPGPVRKSLLILRAYRARQDKQWIYLFRICAPHRNQTCLVVAMEVLGLLIVGQVDAAVALPEAVGQAVVEREEEAVGEVEAAVIQVVAEQEPLEATEPVAVAEPAAVGLGAAA